VRRDLAVLPRLVVPACFRPDGALDEVLPRLVVPACFRPDGALDEVLPRLVVPACFRPDGALDDWARLAGCAYVTDRDGDGHGGGNPYDRLPGP
jgi:hypothetical protein